MATKRGRWHAQRGTEYSVSPKDLSDGVVELLHGLSFLDQPPAYVTVHTVARVGTSVRCAFATEAAPCWNDPMIVEALSDAFRRPIELVSAA